MTMLFGWWKMGMDLSMLAMESQEAGASASR